MNRNNQTAANFVPPADLVEQRHDAPTVQSVWAAWLGNAGAGFGAGIVVAIVVNRLLGFPWQDTAIWGLCAGGLAFGALMVIRFSLDEVVEAWEWQRAMADVARLSDENAALRDRIASLQEDINYERLQRRANAGTPTPRRVDAMPPLEPGPRRDAETLLQRHFMGLSFARDNMTAQAQWTPTRWNEAMEILKAAGIAATNGKRTVVQLGTLTEATDRLNQVGEEL